MSAEEVFEIARRHLGRVKKCGPENIMAVCPFHRGADGREEKTPSFTLSLTRGVYYCFACHERGTLRRLLRELGASYSQLAGEYKYVLEGLTRHSQAKHDPLRAKPPVEPLPEHLLGLFEQVPLALLDEGFEEKVLYKFDVGYDATHERITFPLRDLDGHLIGISGRAEDGIEPRYKVYDKEYVEWGLPERDTKKADILWNAHSVLPEVYFGTADRVVIVEGFKACMWLVQNGITATVALLGSYMSNGQLDLLEQLAPKEVCLMLDNDDAGFKGRSYIGRLLSRRFSQLKIVEYEARQPSDLEPGEVSQVVNNGVQYFVWKCQNRKAINLEGESCPTEKTLDSSQG